MNDLEFAVKMEEYFNKKVQYVKQQIKGEWIETGKMFVELNGEEIVYEVICNRCKGLSYFRKVTNVLIGAVYCPCCGTEMKVRLNNEKEIL